MPNKEKPVDVTSGVLDKKTKGPLLLALTFNTSTMPIIVSVPPIVPISLPRYIIQPPNVIRFQNTTFAGILTLTYPHLHKVCQCVTTLVAFVDNADETPRYRTDDLEEYFTTLAGILVARLPAFLSVKIPNNRTDLLPGYHWVWDFTMGSAT